MASAPAKALVWDSAATFPLGVRPDFENHQRFFQLLHRLNETLGTLYSFNIRCYHFGVRVLVEIGNKIRFIYIRPVAHTDKTGSSQFVLGQPIHHCSTDCSTLGYECDFSLVGQQGPGRTQGDDGDCSRPDSWDRSPERRIFVPPQSPASGVLRLPHQPH